MKIGQLSDKPSELILQALVDLERVESDSRYTIDMSIWHRKYHNETTCIVCFAGAVMSRAVTIDRNVTPSDFPEEFGKLQALDEFRCGRIETGLQYMGISRPESLPPGVYVMPYEADASLFKTAMRKMSRHLAGVGL